ncbi:hypothetical protein GWI33_019236 [Rhynchophorus ferrugineus]|uniref:G-protein coupled receptors family 1 profile domain-containing protein n=1 Tax=Rhynchophorus ferrugineus TaxID=354439 RepID=A0A834HS34_RHYFE|nr:hypothetical protein GWI33_019236 [Rhynchophorus ferrugineus]
MKFFIAQLAFADLSVGLISVLTDIIWRMTIAWYAGDISCKFIKFAQVNQPQCWIEFEEQWHWQLYMVLICLALFVIPAIIITTCYAIMIKTIWSKSATQFSKGNKNGTNDRIGSDTDRRASSRGLIPRAKVKTIKITLIIVTVFILCWSPYIIFDLLQVFGYVPPTQTNTAIASFIQSLAPLNSAANPIIYGIFSTQFCKILGNIAPFKWCRKQNKRKSRNSTTKSSTISEVLTNTTKRRADMVTSINKAHTAIVVAIVHEKT